MKNNITRKTALKTICGLILMLLSISNYSFAQVQNVPEGLYTDLGTLEDPIEHGENEENWTFINNSDCDLTLSHWFTFNGIPNPLVYNGINILAGGTVTITNSTYLTYFGLTGTQSITNMAFQINLGAGYFASVYPNTPITISTGQPSPCDCLKWIPNIATKTFTIEKCP